MKTRFALGYSRKYIPYFRIDKKTGESIPVYVPANAVSQEAKPGYKAGNSHLDEILEEERIKDEIGMSDRC